MGLILSDEILKESYKNQELDNLLYELGKKVGGTEKVEIEKESITIQFGQIELNLRPDLIMINAGKYNTGMSAKFKDIYEIIKWLNNNYETIRDIIENLELTLIKCEKDIRHNIHQLKGLL